MDGVRFPHITVELVDKSGNAFYILGTVLKEMKRNHVTKEDQDKFLAEATSGNYDNLLQMVMRWVNIE